MTDRYDEMACELFSALGCTTSQQRDRLAAVLRTLAAECLLAGDFVGYQRGTERLAEAHAAGREEMRVEVLAIVESVVRWPTWRAEVGGAIRAIGTKPEPPIVCSRCGARAIVLPPDGLCRACLGGEP